MGFLNLLGDVMGQMAAMGEEFKSLRGEYEHMNNTELVREFKDLKGRSSNESKKRLRVVVGILKDRGVIKDN